MKNKQVIIGIEESGWGRACIHRLQELNTVGMEYVLVTQYEEMEPFIVADQVMAVIMEEKWYTKQWNEIDAIPVMLLSEQRVKQEQEKEKVTYHFKYQSIQPIQQWILEQYYKQQGVHTLKEQKANMLTMVSYGGNINTSLAAYALGTIYAKKKKTLLINLERFPYEPEHIATPYSLSDLIYAITTTKHSNKLSFSQCKYQVEELDCLTPTIYYKDMEQMTMEDIVCLLDYIKEQEQYDVIIILADVVSSYFMNVLAYSHEILLCTSQHMVGKQKEQLFLKMLSIEQKEQLYEKIKRCSIPEVEEKGEEECWEAMKHYVEPFVKECSREWI